MILSPSLYMALKACVVAGVQLCLTTKIMKKCKGKCERGKEERENKRVKVKIKVMLMDISVISKLRV